MRRDSLGIQTILLCYLCCSCSTRQARLATNLKFVFVVCCLNGARYTAQGGEVKSERIAGCPLYDAPLALAVLLRAGVVGVPVYVEVAHGVSHDESGAWGYVELVRAVEENAQHSVSIALHTMRN